MADVKNFATASVTTAPSPATTGTTIVVDDSSQFVVGRNATVFPKNKQPTAANAEIVTVTANSANTLTVTRAQESSTARTVLVGDQVVQGITSKTVADIEASVTTLQANRVQLGGDLTGTVGTPLSKARTVTTVVATASSGYAADSSTDGTADQVELNAAIAAGGHVKVRKGNYYLAAPLTLGTNNVRFECEPGVIFLKTDYNGNVVNITGTDIIAEGFKVDGQRSTATHDNQGIVISGSRVHLRDVFVTEVVHHGINTSGGTEITLENCHAENTGMVDSGTFTGADGVGIIAGANSSNVKILNCTANNTGYHCFQIYTNTDQVFMDNCHGTRPGQTQNTGSGLKINPGCNDVTISNSYFNGAGSGNNSPGVLLLSNDAEGVVDNVTLSNCTVTGFAQAGVELEGTTNINIIGGRIFNNGQNSTSSTSYGIRMVDSETTRTVNHVNIIGTRIYDTQATATQGRPIGVYGASTNVFINSTEFYGHGTSNGIFKDAAATGTIYTGFNLGDTAPTWEYRSTEPRLILNETDTGTNSRRWDIRANTAVLSFRVLNDADTVRTSWLDITRSTTTPTVATWNIPIAFSGTANAGLKVNSLTTTQRDALTAANGMIIYNTTTNTLQKYENGAWADISAGGSGAPASSSYVTLATDGTLTSERVLTGTSNQIIITDGGAGGNVTLSTPQDIGTGSSPTFAGLNVAGNVYPDGTAARIVGGDSTHSRATTGVGNSLTVQAPGAQSGGTDLNGGALILSAGISTGNGGSSIDFLTARDSQGTGTTDRTPAGKARISSAVNGRMFIGAASNGTVDGLEMGGTVARTVQTARHSTANTAGNTMTVKGGGATSGATDKAGGDVVVSPGVSTGTGGANARIQTMTRATATGTGDNTAVDRIVCQSPKSVTNNTATTIATLTVASGSAASGTLNYSVEVSDGTNFQTEAGVIAYSCTNAAGTIANNTVTKIGSNQSVTSGTLAVTWTLTTSGTLQVNANSSLTPSTGYPRVTFVLHNTTQQAVAIA